MDTIVVKTNAFVNNPDRVVNGYVLKILDAKVAISGYDIISATFRIRMASAPSSSYNFIIRVYNGEMYLDGSYSTPIVHDNVYTIGSTVVKEYILSLSSADSSKYCVSTDTTCVTVITEDGPFTLALDSDKNNNGFSFDINQIIENYPKDVTLPYVSVVRCGDKKNTFDLSSFNGYTFASSLNFMRSNVSGTLGSFFQNNTFLLGASNNNFTFTSDSGVTGTLENCADILKAKGVVSKRLTFYLTSSGVTYNDEPAETLRVDFDANGDYTITEIS